METTRPDPGRRETWSTSILVGIVAVLVVVFTGIGIVKAAIANAASPTFCHYSPDDGLDSAIHLIDSNGDNVYVAEGRCSTYYTSLDPVAIVVPSGQEIWCKYSGGWHRAFTRGTTILLPTFNDGAGCTKRVA